MPSQPSAIREAIGKQRTVPHSVAALLRAVSARIYGAADTGDMASVVALADDIAANGASWVGAITQNTPAAEQVDAMTIDFSLVPTGMGEEFGTPGVRPVAAHREMEQAAARTTRPGEATTHSQPEHEQQDKRAAQNTKDR